MKWQPIETAPADVLHVRGLWVHSSQTGLRLWWECHAGIIDEDGDFVAVNGDDFGWHANDYTHWMPLPPPPTE